MANTVTETITVSLSGTNVSVSLNGSTSTPQVGSNYTKETQIIATGSWQALDVGAAITAGTLGWLVVRNLDPATSTSSVSIASSSDGTNLVGKLTGGRGIYIAASPAKTYYAEATGASVQVEFLAIEL